MHRTAYSKFIAPSSVIRIWFGWVAEPLFRLGACMARLRYAGSTPLNKGSATHPNHMRTTSRPHPKRPET